jgi:hypothetical protein
MNKKPHRNQTQLLVEMLSQPARLGKDTGLRSDVFDPFGEKGAAQRFPANNRDSANLQQGQRKEIEFLAWIQRQKNLVARLDSLFPQSEREKIDRTIESYEACHPVTAHGSIYDRRHSGLQLCSMTEILNEIHARELINRSSPQMSHAISGSGANCGLDTLNLTPSVRFYPFFQMG